MHGVAGGGGGGMGYSTNTPSNTFYAGFGGGAGAYVQKQLKYDQLLDGSNILVTVGTGGSSTANANVVATDTSINYQLVTGGVSLNLERGGMYYKPTNPGEDVDGGSGSGASFSAPAGTGVGATASFTQNIAGNDGGDDTGAVAHTIGGVYGGYNSGGGGGGANTDGGDATYATEKGGSGGQGQMGAAYTLSLSGTSYTHLDNINDIFPLGRVFIGQGGGGGGYIRGDMPTFDGTSNISAGLGGNVSVDATSAISGSGSGGGGARINQAPGGLTYYEGGAGGDGSFAVSYRAAWRIFVIE